MQTRTTRASKRRDPASAVGTAMGPNYRPGGRILLRVVCLARPLLHHGHRQALAALAARRNPAFLVRPRRRETCLRVPQRAGVFKRCAASAAHPYGSTPDPMAKARGLRRAKGHRPVAPRCNCATRGRGLPHLIGTYFLAYAAAPVTSRATHGSLPTIHA